MQSVTLRLCFFSICSVGSVLRSSRFIMPPPAGRDRFFQQTRDDGEGRSRLRKQYKPRVQRTPRSDDPFFASHSDDQQNDSDGEERKERDADDSNTDVNDRSASQGVSHKLNHNNKRPRAHHNHTADNSDNGDHTPASSTDRSTSHPAHPPKRRKDAPLEMSSKHPTPLPTLSSLHLLQPKSLQPRDPRFDPLLPATSYSSHFNAQGAYKFLDELKEDEVKAMTKVHKKLRSQAKKADMKAQLQSIASTKKEAERKEREQSALRVWKKQEMAARRDGKRPFYLKERDKKAVKLVSEYSRMKESGQQGAIVRKVEKKRRQRAQHDQKSMPRQALGGGQ